MSIYEIVRYNIINSVVYSHKKGKENKATTRLQNMLDEAYYKDVSCYEKLHKEMCG